MQLLFCALINIQEWEILNFNNDSSFVETSIICMYICTCRRLKIVSEPKYSFILLVFLIISVVYGILFAQRQFINL